MPHIKTDAKYKIKKQYVIYAILSPFDDKFYVGKTLKSAVRGHYKDHYTLRKNQTKELFSKAKEMGLTPKMYQLEELETTDAEAYSCCIAWTRYFIERKKESINYKKTDEYAMHLTQNTAIKFKSIAHIPLESIINDERDLFPNYGNLRKPDEEPDNGNVILTFRVTQKDAEKIRQMALKKNCSVSQLCRDTVLDGCHVEVDFLFLSRYLSELRGAKSLLKQTMLTIYQTGRYYPPDLANIQKMVDVVEEHEQKINKEILKAIKGFRKDIHAARRKPF